MFGPRENWGKGDEMAVVRERAVRQEGGGQGRDALTQGVPTERPVGAEKTNKEKKPVKGFVSIKCPECGRVHNTCLHEERTIFNCKACGQPVALKGLKSIKMECPRCRFKARYLTNRQERKIQMECLNCSQPVNFRQGFRRGNYVVEVEV